MHFSVTQAVIKLEPLKCVRPIVYPGTVICTSSRLQNFNLQKYIRFSDDRLPMPFKFTNAFEYLSILKNTKSLKRSHTLKHMYFSDF